MGTLLQDLKFGCRMLIKNPAFTAIAVLSLGLGIGANTTIFTFVNALLFRPPAVESPGQLLAVWNRNVKASGLDQFMPLTFPDYLYFRDNNKVFSGLLAFDGDPLPVSWSKSGEGEKVQGGLVSGNYFSVAGVKLILGRAFTPAEDGTPGVHPVVVLSHAFWKERLGADPQVLGKTFNFNGTNFTAVGVAPAGFNGLLIGMGPDFWAPLAMTVAITRDQNFLTSRDASWLLVAGRLKPETTAAQAQAEFTVLSRHLQRAYPESNKDLEASVFALNLVPTPFRGYVAAFTGLLMAVVGLVLLIACANAANLLLAQATARRREMAIRAALGAGRGRLIRQTLIESTLVAVLGGCAAFIMASWIAPALLALAPPDLPLKLEVPIDWRVFAFTLVVSLATGFFFGIAAALRGAKMDVGSALKDEWGIGGYRRSRLRGSLVVAQIAVCLVLLISAGLCVRSLLNAQSIDPGFDTQQVVISVLDPGSMGYSEQKGRMYYQQLVERVQALPGVTSASLAGYLPLTTQEQTLAVDPEGVPSQPGGKQNIINATDVGPGYFGTMNIPLLRGREFTAHDGLGSPSVGIINEELAKRFWPGQDPIGRRVIEGGPESHQLMEVVGVVKTGKYRMLSEAPRPFLFRPLLQDYHSKCTLVVRAAGDPHGMLSAVRREVQALDPTVVPFDLETMKEYMAFPLFPARTTGLLLGAFGFLALVLAVAGLYGVMAYAVSQRTREIGVRMALGAVPRDVLRLVVGHGMVLTLIGIGIGLAGAFAATRVLSSLLYGISATDPSTFVLVPLALAGVALAASYIPARRATKVDPMVALRYE
jgi:predicted permease